MTDKRRAGAQSRGHIWVAQTYGVSYISTGRFPTS